MHCIERRIEPRSAARRRLLASLGAALGAAVAGCGGPIRFPGAAEPPPPATPAPDVASPAPAVAAPLPPPAPAPAPAPAAAAAAPAPGSRLPAPGAARNWDDFKRQAARRLVAASPEGSYTGPAPAMLLGIPILETELNADGSVRNINVLRRPADERAQDTIQLAMDAIRRAAPYGDVSRLPRPWKWTEIFLFNDKRQFKPRTLDN